MPPFESLFGQFVGRLAQSFSTGNVVWDEMVKGFARLSEHASGRWAQVGAAGIRCTTHYRPPGGEVEACELPAIAACMSCGQPVCMTHAFINVVGDVCCGTCIHVKLLQGQPAAWPGKVPPPPPQAPQEDRVALRKRYLRLLKLRGRVTAEDVTKAYRKLAAQAHPDRHPEVEKKAAQERFIELGKAKDWLLEELKRTS
jgi:hypothetical protein